MNDTKRVILCVDDDVDLLDSLRALLEGAGYRMVAATSAQAALKTIEEVCPDFILVDMMMESIDAGIDLVAKLRAKGTGVPIFMLSSAADSLSMTVDAGQIGLDGVLQKPVSPESLLTILKGRLGA